MIRQMTRKSIAIAGLCLAWTLGGCPDDDKLPIFATCSADAQCQSGMCGGGICLDPDVVSSPGSAVPHPDPFTPASPSPVANPTVRGCGPQAARVALFRIPGCAGTVISQPTVNIEDPACRTGWAFEAQIDVPEEEITAIYALVPVPGELASICAELGRYEHDATPPAAPIQVGFVPASPSFDPHPVIVGTAEAHAMIDVYLGPECPGTPEALVWASPDGDWLAVVDVPANATTQLSARATDRAGNVSACGALDAYTHDDVPPVAPAMTQAQLDALPNPSTNASPTISGCAEADSTVHLYTGPTCGASVTSAVATDAAAGCPAGQLGFTATLTVPTNATTDLRARAIDVAGNRSDCGLLVAYVHDTTPPMPPVPSEVRPVSVAVGSGSFVVTGLAEPGVLARAYLSPGGATGDRCVGTPAGEALVGSDGVFAVELTITDLTSPAEASFDALDGAGNVSPCSDPVTLVGPAEIWVIDAAGDPVAGAIVAFQDLEGEPYAEVVTAADGIAVGMVFVGAMATTAVQLDLTRRLFTVMDLEPGDAILVDAETHPGGSGEGPAGQPTEVLPVAWVSVGINENAPTEGWYEDLEYEIATPCGVQYVYGWQVPTSRGFTIDCREPGDTVDIVISVVDYWRGEVIAFARESFVLEPGEFGFGFGADDWRTDFRLLPMSVVHSGSEVGRFDVELGQRLNQAFYRSTGDVRVADVQFFPTMDTVTVDLPLFPFGDGPLRLLAYATSPMMGSGNPDRGPSSSERALSVRLLQLEETPDALTFDVGHDLPPIIYRLDADPSDHARIAFEAFPSRPFAGEMDTANAMFTWFDESPLIWQLAYRPRAAAVRLPALSSGQSAFTPVRDVSDGFVWWFDGSWISGWSDAKETLGVELFGTSLVGSDGLPEYFPPNSQVRLVMCCDQGPGHER